MTFVPPSLRDCCHPVASANRTVPDQACPAGRSRKWLGVLLLAIVSAWMPAGTAPTAWAQRRKGEFEIRVVDAETSKPIAVNIFLKDARGRAVPAKRLPFWKDHFAFQHSVVLELNPGPYTFEMERGPEYKVRRGEFVIEPGATDNTQVTMERFVDMKKEGWWSGDLHVHRPPTDMPLLMLASDLHVAPVITWWNERNAWKETALPPESLVRFDDDRFYHLLAGEDEREGGALLYFNLPRPLELPATSDREYPPMSRFLELAKQSQDAHVDIEKPFWWDVPVWTAMGLADSIGLANNHLCRSGMLANEAWGKPRDKVLYPNPRGNGYWSQDIYYHLLNCGLRIPPSAGSASGVLDNPVGYNRVYVHCGDDVTYASWWEGLKAGRVVVTNGPLLRPRVNGELPGHVFRGEPGEVVELTVQLSLSLQERVDYLEVIQNGKIAHEVRLEEYRDRRGTLPPVRFEQSGWMLVRAVTANPQTFRFASTGPYYVEIGQKPRISRESAQFFLDWVNERMANVKLPDPHQQAEVLKYQEMARNFWQQKVDAANAE